MYDQVGGKCHVWPTLDACVGIFNFNQPQFIIFLCNFRAVGSMIFTLFFPLIPFVLEIIVCFYWGASALYLASMGDSTFTASNETTVNNSGTVESVVEQAIAEIPCDPNVSYDFMARPFYAELSQISIPQTQGEWLSMFQNFYSKSQGFQFSF